MGFIDKMFGSMKYDDDDYEEPRKSAKRGIKAATMDDDDFEGSRRPAKAPAPSQAPRNGRSKVMSNGMEVCVIKPTSVEDAREITDTLLDNRTVLLNMEGLDLDLAQRIIDFTSGSTYAIDGNLQKISHYIFILTPRNVDVSGDFQEIISGAFDVPALNNKF